jgi:2-amino-4-hydroxy-6-hydroxymethyldihydropteridine diphosphokinase
MDAVVGLGANLGDRRAAFEAAITRLHLHAEVRAISRLYETAPVGPPQPLFLNAAVRLSSHLAPDDLLDWMQEIERTAGRVRKERWGPRCLDLDLLWIDGLAIRGPRLHVPHPELEERPFALIPLLDVAPGAADPRTGHRYADVLRGLDTTGVRRLTEELDFRPNLRG